MLFSGLESFLCAWDLLFASTSRDLCTAGNVPGGRLVACPLFLAQEDADLISFATKRDKCIVRKRNMFFYICKHKFFIVIYSWKTCILKKLCSDIFRKAHLLKSVGTGFFSLLNNPAWCLLFREFPCKQLL